MIELPPPGTETVLILDFGSQTAQLSSVRTLTFNGGVPGDWIVT